MRHIYFTLLGLMLLCFISLFYVIYCVFVPVKTLVINNFSYTSPIYVKTPVLHPGDVLKYDLDYCKYTDVLPVSRRKLVDGQQIGLTGTGKGAGLLRGCHVIERDVTIPETINPGRYYLDVEVDYQVNMFHTERVYYYTQYFQVVSAKVPSTSEPAANVSTAAIPSRTEALSAIMTQ